MISKRLDKSLSALIKDADTVFSEFIRRRYADNSGNVSCFICGAPMHWKRAQCAHFIHRQAMVTRYDEVNCHQSCEACNCYDGEHFVKYRERMIEVYGEQIVSKLIDISRRLQKFTRADLVLLIDTYKDKLKELK